MDVAWTWRISGVFVVRVVLNFGEGDVTPIGWGGDMIGLYS